MSTAVPRFTAPNTLNHPEAEMVSFNRILRSVAIATAFTAVTNCSESTTAPGRSLAPSFNESHSKSENHQFKTGKGSHDEGLPQGHHITISTSSICNPGTSLYGPGTWDLPCQDTDNDIQITANVSTGSNGHPRIDFYPALRFDPNGQDVILTIHDDLAAKNPNSVILYCNDLGLCVNEGKTDPSLITYHDAAKGIIWRRIKHFSGYAVTGDCDPSVDPTCGNQS